MDTLKNTLRDISRLQPHYSPDNTDKMEQRGRLIRNTLVDEIKSRKEILKNALGEFGVDFDVGASDGIGRKTEAPWVRFYSKSMSPSPREGYYFVIHFSRDGRFVFFTVGCGSTIWANGSLRPVQKNKLQEKVNIAQKQIVNVLGSLGSFKDEIVLGAKAPLPRTFERATATAKKIEVNLIENVNLEELLEEGAIQLRAVYQMQSIGGDLTQELKDQISIEEAIKPNRNNRSKAQGFGLTGPERKAVELQAMGVASSWFLEKGYSVFDTSATEPFDLLVEKDGSLIKVEVKGSTSQDINSIMMTSNEISLHQEEQGFTALALVSQINLVKGAKPICNGGKLEVLLGWQIDEWTLEPTSYRVTR
jgi:hypothetical protein